MTCGRPPCSKGEGEGERRPPLLSERRGHFRARPASLNSNVDGGIAARAWFEYAVTIRSPFGSSMCVR